MISASFPRFGASVGDAVGGGVGGSVGIGVGSGVGTGVGSGVGSGVGTGVGCGHLLETMHLHGERGVKVDACELTYSSRESVDSGIHKE